jgi:hypothetical protein
MKFGSADDDDVVAAAVSHPDIPSSLEEDEDESVLVTLLDATVIAAEDVAVLLDLTLLL